MSDTSTTDYPVAEATAPEDGGEAEDRIGEPFDPTYLERLNEETS